MNVWLVWGRMIELRRFPELSVIICSNDCLVFGYIYGTIWLCTRSDEIWMRMIGI